MAKNPSSCGIEFLLPSMLCELIARKHVHRDLEVLRKSELFFRPIERTDAAKTKFLHHVRLSCPVPQAQTFRFQPVGCGLNAELA